MTLSNENWPTLGMVRTEMADARPCLPEGVQSTALRGSHDRHHPAPRAVLRSRTAAIKGGGMKRDGAVAIGTGASRGIGLPQRSAPGRCAIAASTSSERGAAVGSSHVHPTSWTRMRDIGDRNGGDRRPGTHQYPGQQCRHRRAYASMLEEATDARSLVVRRSRWPSSMLAWRTQLRRQLELIPRSSAS
jgi:hypothetical protein